MSIFVPISLPCPACGTAVTFGAVLSVNADRRPDLREAILSRSFQRESCPKCSESFRLDPELTYFDMARQQWILVQPASKLPQWVELEKQAATTFERTYGPGAPPMMQALGRKLQARVTFGWAALREKLLAVEHGLQDADLELLKAMLLRGMDNSPLADDTELRLVEVEGETLVLAWIKAANEAMLQTLRVPRSLCDEIAADQADWQPLRTEVSAGPFVDVHRLLIAAPA